MPPTVTAPPLLLWRGLQGPSSAGRLNGQGGLCKSRRICYAQVAFVGHQPGPVGRAFKQFCMVPGTDWDHRGSIANDPRAIYWCMRGCPNCVLHLTDEGHVYLTNYGTYTKLLFSASPSTTDDFARDAERTHAADALAPVGKPRVHEPSCWSGPENRWAPPPPPPWNAAMQGKSTQRRSTPGASRGWFKVMLAPNEGGKLRDGNGKLETIPRMIS